MFIRRRATGVHSAVIVMPGGGYTHLAIEKEGGAEARWLNEHGVTAFVLEYRLGPRYHFPSPMLDGARAVRYVRSHAAELDVAKDRIGLWGFSAGGHLAGYLATVHDSGAAGASDPIERVSDRPDFVIVSYGRFSMDESIPRKTNMEGLLGDHPTQAMLDAVSVVKLVTKEYSTLLYLLDYRGPDGELDECDGTLRRAEESRRAGGAAYLRTRRTWDRHGTGAEGSAGAGDLSDAAGELDGDAWMDDAGVGCDRALENFRKL